jgi:ABC-type polysaccharide/polyol phosphate export permease
MMSGLRFWRLWVALAKEDLGIRHRGTLLGPVWILVNYVLLAGTFILLFHNGTNKEIYVAHALIGLLVWQFIADVMNTGSSLFHRNRSYISGSKLPISFYIYNSLTQSVLRLFYAFIGCVVLLVLFGSTTVSGIPAAFGSFLILLLIAPAAIIVFAFMGAYFPDSRFAITNFTRIAMFLTPVFWMHDGAHGVRALLYFWNPFTHFVEIVRLPLMYGTYPWQSLLICLAIGCIAWIIAALMFMRLRRHVVFVV